MICQPNRRLRLGLTMIGLMRTPPNVSYTSQQKIARKTLTNLSILHWKIVGMSLINFTCFATFK